jgi:hypothetical protein
MSEDVELVSPFVAKLTGRSDGEVRSTRSSNFPINQRLKILRSMRSLAEIHFA